MTPPLAKRKCGCERYICDVCGTVIGSRTNALWKRRCFRHQGRWGGMSLATHAYDTYTVCDDCAHKMPLILTNIDQKDEVAS